MRDSIWSAPGYDEADFMEKGLSRAETLLEESFKKIPGDNWYTKLKHCTSCKCCPRHQTLKPNRLVPWTETETENIIPPWVHTNCECDCRHMARHICRQVTVNNNDEYIMPPCPRQGPILEDAM